mmetsp:Transcript_8349/g.15191  ORF Transcript_8349/g.15191 Transcript_8349/m.15191 type:complete len:347 (+) Transcript_8349:65-1105(+)
MAFTPVESATGGVLIGLSALVAYLADGKVAGISGIMGPWVRSVLQCDAAKEVWKMFFLIGLALGGLANFAFNEAFAFPGAIPFSLIRYAACGVIIGVGTRLQRGCTSGHGICGLPRFSSRSWMAVPLFMAVAAGTVWLTHHGLKLDKAASSFSVAPLKLPDSGGFPFAALGASLLLAALAFAPLGEAVHGCVSPLAAGIIFGLGLGVSGMTDQDKVISFLDFFGAWDPSLAFVMGCGILVSFPAYYLAETREKPHCAAAFEKPPKTGNYGSLAAGAVLFGAGWGLVGICPGPGLAGVVPNLVLGHGGYGFAACTAIMCASWVATDKVQAMTTATAPAAADEKPLLK